MKKEIRFLLFLGALSVSAAAQADTGVLMNLVDENGVGKEIGQVTISETAYGLVFSPAVTGLPPGLHGFHVHENASCEPKEKDGKRPAVTTIQQAANTTVRPGGTVIWGICPHCPRMQMATPVLSWHHV